MQSPGDGVVRLRSDTFLAGWAYDDVGEVVAGAPGFATELYMKGIVAAVIGGLASPTGAIAGGYGLAVLESGVRRIFLRATLPGLELVVTLAVVLVVLVVRPTGFLATARTRGAA